jgi:hypothetical protein
LSALKRVSRWMRKIEPITRGSARAPGAIRASSGATAVTNACAGST